jgi:LemA protein
MTGTLIVLALIIIGVPLLLFFYGVAIYNKLVAMKNDIENSWAQIDVQLKRRYDLIPNLVETVKGYASHEKDTLERVIKARNAAIGALQQGPGAVSEAEGALNSAMRGLFGLSEAYPDLKANTSFMALQEELTSTENKIAFARQYFNDRTTAYNTRIALFPDVFVAGMFQFTRKELFEVKEAEQREVVKVSFS